MLKLYKFPLMVWIAVLAFSVPLNYLFKYLYAFIPAFQNYSGEITYLNVLIGYLGSLIVCLPFYLVFWVIFAALKKTQQQKIRLYMVLIGQVIWWVPFYVILVLLKDYSWKDLLTTFLPYSIILIFATGLLPIKSKA